MNPLDIIAKYYPAGSDVYRILVMHSRSVADKALAIARMHPEMNLDLTFIEEAAMLHDIGIFRCNAPDIDCHGEAEYICHGYLGAELMRAEGYPRHARVCERHTGTGITLAMIEERKSASSTPGLYAGNLGRTTDLFRRQVLQQNEAGQRKICRKGKTRSLQVWE